MPEQPHGRPKDAGYTILELIVVVGVMGSLAFLFYSIFTQILARSKAQTAASVQKSKELQAQTDALAAHDAQVKNETASQANSSSSNLHNILPQDSQSTATTSSTSTHSTPMYLSPLPEISGLGLGALVIAVVVHRYSLKFRATKRASLAAKTAVHSRWLKAHQSHENLMSEYSHYLFSLEEILKKPALSDGTVTQTAVFLEAMNTLGSIPDTEILDSGELQIYEERVAKAVTAWSIAQEYASKLGLGIFNNEERRKVVRARDLLQVALDPAASEFERGAAYQQVKKLVDGLVVVPKQAILSIESKLRLSLEAGPASSSILVQDSPAATKLT